MINAKIDKDSGLAISDAHWGENDLEIMQYTGLKDVNGVEIYDGDVVKKHISNFTSELDEVGVVEFHLASFFFFEKNIKKPFLLQHPLDTQCSYMGNQIEIQYEVIGNIYEHPHLLEANND